MKTVRSISATAIPNVRTSDFNSSGTANVLSSTAITNTLSSESAFSIRKPDQYSPAAPVPEQREHDEAERDADDHPEHAPARGAPQRDVRVAPMREEQVEREQADHGRDQRDPAGE